MIRIFITDSLHEGVTVALSSPQAHYVKQVMRLKEGESLLVFNGRDGEWRAQLAYPGKKTAEITAINRTREQQSEPDIWLCFAPIKFGRIDYLIQKATELGVARLQPVKTEHTAVSRLNGERLTANAIEAAEQCERLNVPQVADMVTLPSLLENWEQERKLIVCDETGEGQPILQALTGSRKPEGLSVTPSHSARETPDRTASVRGVEQVLRGEEFKKAAILIGPEGGFSRKELALLRAQPYVTAVTLGPRVLRADTAALAAITAWQMIAGDFGEGPRFETR